MHLDSCDDQTDDLVFETPLCVLANVFSHLLEDPTFEPSTAHIEDKDPAEHTTSADPEPCIKGSSPKKYPDSSGEPSTPLHQTMNRLTRDIAQLKIHN